MSYTKAYLKNYFWQGFSFVVKFLSMFIVLPLISANQSIYGIYTLCIGLNIFLSYADFGFIGAGIKFASEEFVKGNISGEKKIIGFCSSILYFMLFFFFIFFIILSLNPSFILSSSNSKEQLDIASHLFLILGLNIPFFGFNRLLNFIFTIRLKDYIIQRYLSLGSVISIISVPFVFFNHKYDIVGYFAFTQIVNALALLAVYQIYARKEGYNWLFIIKCLNLNKDIYTKLKGLAYAGIISILSWIVFFELDSIIITKYLGTTSMAIYAIGLTMLNFCRNLIGIVYSPFQARVNYFVGLNDKSGIIKFICDLITLGSILLIPILLIILFMKPIIFSWIGIEYEKSILVAIFLMAGILPSFISMPANLILMAQNQIKYINVVNFIQPVMYWGGVLLTFHKFGVEAFAFWKFLTFLVCAFLYAFFLKKMIKFSIKKIFTNTFFSCIATFLAMLVLYKIVLPYMYMQKSHVNLLINILILIIVIIIVSAVFIITNRRYRLLLFRTLKSFR